MNKKPRIFTQSEIEKTSSGESMTNYDESDTDTDDTDNGACINKCQHRVGISIKKVFVPQSQGKPDERGNYKNPEKGPQNVGQRGYHYRGMSGHPSRIYHSVRPNFYPHQNYPRIVSIHQFFLPLSSSSINIFSVLYKP